MFKYMRISHAAAMMPVVAVLALDSCRWSACQCCECSSHVLSLHVARPWHRKCCKCGKCCNATVLPHVKKVHGKNTHSTFISHFFYFFYIETNATSNIVIIQTSATKKKYWRQPTGKLRTWSTGYVRSLDVGRSTLPMPNTKPKP